MLLSIDAHSFLAALGLYLKGMYACKYMVVVLVIKMKGTEVTPSEKSAALIMLCWTHSAVCACVLLSIDAYS